MNAVRLAEDARSVTIELAALIAGHVYELRTKNLAPSEETFFPAEAHYTMRRVPVAPRNSNGAPVE